MYTIPSHQKLTAFHRSVVSRHLCAIQTINNAHCLWWSNLEPINCLQLVKWWDFPGGASPRGSVWIALRPQICLTNQRNKKLNQFSFIHMPQVLIVKFPGWVTFHIIIFLNIALFVGWSCTLPNWKLVLPNFTTKDREQCWWSLMCRGASSRIIKYWMQC